MSKSENLLVTEILKALVHLKDLNGSTKTQIIKFVKSNVSENKSNLNQRLSKALKTGVEKRILKERNGKYRIGESFRITEHHLNCLDGNKLCNNCNKPKARRGLTAARRQKRKSSSRGRKGRGRQKRQKRSRRGRRRSTLTRRRRRSHNTPQQEEGTDSDGDDVDEVDEDEDADDSKSETSVTDEERERGRKRAKRAPKKRSASKQLNESNNLKEEPSVSRERGRSKNRVEPIDNVTECDDQKCLCRCSNEKEELGKNDDNNT